MSKLRHGYFFWPYDQFPYLLGGEGKLREDGMAIIPSFGNGTFRPIYTFFDVEKGREVHDMLNLIVHERDVAIKLVSEAASARAAALMGANRDHNR